jgi:hypothetical protein
MIATSLSDPACPPQTTRRRGESFDVKY